MVSSEAKPELQPLKDISNKIELIDRPKSPESTPGFEKRVYNLEDIKENITDLKDFDFGPSKELIIREIESRPQASLSDDEIREISYYEEETIEKTQPIEKKSFKDDKHNERLRKLRELSYTGKQNFEDMENIPAYKRKNINLTQNTPSTDSEVARFTLSDGEDGLEIKSNNKFLHDNVD